jgi:hypothetical protein
MRRKSALCKAIEHILVKITSQFMLGGWLIIHKIVWLI